MQLLASPTAAGGAAKRMDPFETLPVELSLLIIKHMEPRSMVVSGMVSRSWRDLSNDEALWYLPFSFLSPINFLY
jgi:hypothetical protein